MTVELPTAIRDAASWTSRPCRSNIATRVHSFAGELPEHEQAVGAGDGVGGVADQFNREGDCKAEVLGSNPTVGPVREL